MQLGTNEEIESAQNAVHAAEALLMNCKLRLRALKGEPLLQSGAGASVFELTQELDALSKEFGNRNLKMF